MIFENLKCFWKKRILKVSHVHTEKGKGKDAGRKLVTKWCALKCQKHNSSSFSISGGCPECFLDKQKRKIKKEPALWTLFFLILLFSI